MKKENTFKKNNKLFKKFNYAVVHIFSTFNNTIITVSDSYGNIISWSTASSMGFKGNKKSSSYASQLAAEKVVRIAMRKGVRDIDILIKGPGGGRDFAIRGVLNSGVKVISISDITPLPHNGCRAPKVRRK